MEIIDYLRIMRRRLGLLLLIPLLAGGAAAAYVMTSPASYTASATVSASPLTGADSDYGGPQGTNLFVASFSSAATGPRVVNTVSAKTGVGVSVLTSGLTVAQSGASSDMEVGFTSTKKDLIQPVLKEEVTQTLAALFEPKAAAAAQQLKSAKAAVAQANEAVAAYAKKFDVADPEAAFKAQQDVVTNLKQQIANQQAAGNLTAAATLQSRLNTEQEKLQKFGPILAGYQNVAADKSAADDDLATAQTDYRRAKSQVEAAGSPDLVYISATKPVSRVGKLVGLVLPVAAAGVLIGVVLVVALEMLRGARRTEEVPPNSRAARRAAGRTGGRDKGRADASTMMAQINGASPATPSEPALAAPRADHLDDELAVLFGPDVAATPIAAALAHDIAKANGTPATLPERS